MSKLFNVYVSETKQDLIDFDFVVPDFFDKDKFKINVELIPNNSDSEYAANIITNILLISILRLVFQFMPYLHKVI